MKTLEKGGFTLIEIILSLSVLLVILVVTLTVATPAIRSWKRVYEKENSIEECQTALLYLIKDLETANNTTFQIEKNYISFTKTGQDAERVFYGLKNDHIKGLYRGFVKETHTEDPEGELIAIGIESLSCELKDSTAILTLTMKTGTTEERRVYFLADNNWSTSP